MKIILFGIAIILYGISLICTALAGGNMDLGLGVCLIGLIV